MRIIPLSEASEGGGGVLAAAVAGLAVGLLPYSAFLLLARGYYALGDSRTPGVVSVAGASMGVVVMVVGARVAEGSAQVFVLGLGHSTAYAVGVLVLGVGLARRTGARLVPAALGRVVACAAVIGLGVWLAGRALTGDDPSRLVDIATVGGLGLVGAALVAGGAAEGVPEGIDGAPAAGEIGEVGS
jgi:putative peptidoglycan lipid II flippase